MTIRTRILLFQTIVGLALLATVLAGVVARRSFEHHRERGALAHRQLDAMTSLARAADDLSERVAAILTAAAPEDGAVAKLHNDIALGLNRLDRLAREEERLLRAGGTAMSDEAEFARIARLQQLYAEMRLKIDALFALRNGGGRDAATRIFHRDVESGLDDAFEGVIAAGIAAEMQEIAAADREAERLAGRLGLQLAAVTALAVLATGLAGTALYRAIARPIRKLSVGAAAIGSGQLATRIGPLGRDEFGHLARRFDAMAEQLQEWRRRLAAAQAGLEAEVRARTAELQQANAELEDRDRSRLRFLADISHELRTPLTVLRGEAEVTLRDRKPSPDSYRATLMRILDEARDMGRLVDDLLALARSETEQISFDLVPLDLQELAADAAREMQLAARARGVRIDAALGPAHVEGDRQRMKQIVTILLDNAVKYARPGSTVELRLESCPQAVTLTVANESEHLAEDEAPRLFDRFYRGRNAAAAGSSGSGLGLAIASWLTEQQNGTIGLAYAAGRIEATLRFPPAPALDRSERRIA